MKKFKFRLEPLLKKNELIVKKFRLELSKLEGIKVKNEEDFSAYKKRLSQVDQDVKIILSRKIEMDKIKRHYDFSLHLRDSMNRKVLENMEVDKKIAALTNELRVYAQKKKSLEKLKAKQLSDFRRLMNKQEQRQLEELGRSR